MTQKEIILALLTVRPGAEWNLRGPNYEDLEWLDEVQIKPTAAELGL